VHNGEAWKKIARFQGLILTCPKQNKINSVNSADVKNTPNLWRMNGTTTGPRLKFLSLFLSPG